MGTLPDQNMGSGFVDYTKLCCCHNILSLFDL
jgi:hypothetical protein